jgi:hypothetical protein
MPAESFRIRLIFKASHANSNKIITNKLEQSGILEMATPVVKQILPDQ